MGCTAYGSTSNMSLYYTTDADPDAAIAAATLTWKEVPITSESLAANLTSSISDRITASRSYANSVVTQGEVSGSIGFEAEAGTFMDDMLKAALQVTSAWASGASIQNGSSVSCLAFLKKVRNAAGTDDYYVFRGCQVDSMSINVSPGSFITGELSIMGTRSGAGLLGAAAPANDALTTKPAGWTLTPVTSTNLMSSVFALQNLEVQDTTGTDIGVIAQELSLTMSNQLRQQFAVGTGTPFAAGVASGRFQCTATLNAYYSDPTIVNAMMADDDLKLVFSILDAAGEGWSFLCDFCKITSAPPPSASGPDADVMSSTELQAFESATNGSVKITKSA